MDPLLIDVPERLLTPRLVLRAPQAGDGPAAFAAIVESFAELSAWMPWTQGEAPAVATSESFARASRAKFLARSDLVFYGFLRDEGRGGEGGDSGDGGAVAEGPMVLATGLHRMDWAVPRFEIGYWRRSGFGGHGLVDEAVQALTALAFSALKARRVEIRMDARNRRSWRVAERCGFTFEGCLRSDALDLAGEPRDTRVYAKVRGVEWRDADGGGASDPMVSPDAGAGHPSTDLRQPAGAAGRRRPDGA